MHNDNLKPAAYVFADKYDGFMSQPCDYLGIVSVDNRDYLEIKLMNGTVVLVQPNQVVIG